MSIQQSDPHQEQSRRERFIYMARVEHTVNSKGFTSKE